MTNKRTVALQGDARSLIASLRDAFTGHGNVLRELLQNARRAGTDRVEIHQDADQRTLEVVDYGCGIADFQNLLFIGRTGWDAETIAAESPFGIGFLAAVSSCERIEIESNGVRLAARCRDILEFRPVELEACATSCTRIRLHGFEPYKCWSLEQSVAGFEIPVILNGKPLNRPDAPDDSYAACEIGRVKLGAIPSLDFVAYLQGFEIASERNYRSEGTAIIHLNSTAFRARVPDRDVLIDAQQQKDRIRAALRAAWRARLAVRKAEGDSATLVRHAGCLKRLACADLLNDIPVLPAAALSPIDLGNLVAGDVYGPAGAPAVDLSREEAERAVLVPAQVLEDATGNVYASGLCNALEEGAADYNRLVYLGAVGAIELLDGVLDEGHWVYGLPLVRAVDLKSITAADPSGSGALSGHRAAVRVAACRTVQFDGSLGPAQSAAVPVIREDDGVLLLGAEVDGTTFCQVWDSYQDSNDHFDESQHDDDVRMVHAQLKVIRGAGAALLIDEALASELYGQRALLAGRRFSVVFDRRGAPKVVEVRRKAPRKRRRSKPAPGAAA